MGEIPAHAALVGRQRELAIVTGVLDQASAGTFQAVLLEGEAGIGKTRLLESALHQARRRDFRVFETFLEPGLSPDGSALSALTGGQARGGDRGQEESRLRLVQGSLERVEDAATGDPVAVALDDLQWADDTTLLAVRSMVTRMRHLPVAMLLALRSGADSGRVGSVVQELISAGGVHLDVGPLGSDALRQLVSSEVGARPGQRLTELLHQVGGNPFYARQLVRTLSADGDLQVDEDIAEARTSAPPPSLQASILRHLRSHGQDAVHALRVGATLGVSFAVTDLSVVMGRTPVALLRDLEGPLRGGVLGEHDDRLAFRHPLLREALYLDLPRSARTALHLEAGRSLAAAGRPAAAVAAHLARGASRGDVEAIGWIREGADAVLPSDPPEAVRLLRHARDLAIPGTETRSGVVASLISALAWAGQLPEAVSAGREALHDAPSPEARARLRARLAAATRLHGRFGTSLHHVEAALAEEALDRQALGALLGEAAISHLFRGQLDEAGELTGTARSGGDGESPYALAADGWIATLRGQLDRGCDLTSSAAALAERSGPGRAFRPLGMLALAWDRAGRTAEAEQLLGRKLRQIEENGSVHDVAWNQCALGMLRFHLGQWDDAKADLDSGLSLADELGAPPLSGSLWPQAVRALIATHEGALDHAAAVLAGLEDQTDAWLGLEWVRWAQAILYEARGDHAAALDALDEGWDIATRFGFRSEQPLLGPDLVRLAVAQGRRDLARDVTGALNDAAVDLRTGIARVAALQSRGLVEGSLDSLLEAVLVAKEMSRPLRLAAVREHAGLACAEAGRLDEGTASLLEARDGYAKLGARRDSDRVDALLRQRGVRRGVRGARARPQHGWASLTDREREVAELVAEGLTNRQIAERLYVSPRTVGTHISHVLSKLDLRSRLELGVQVARFER